MVRRKIKQGKITGSECVCIHVCTCTCATLDKVVREGEWPVGVEGSGPCGCLEVRQGRGAREAVGTFDLKELTV